MKRAFSLLFLALIYIEAHSQLTEIISHINVILSENRTGSGVQKIESDKFGNVVLYSTSGSYWFNLNDVIGFDENELFLFPPTSKIRCSPGPCEERIVLIGNKVYSAWGR